ncbi:MAG: class I SAM-dependent methyltransferase [Eggerthellaceae bacterium]|nr:class I SAM-dependent methyltransferase [Eggerthellaceae bacterium]
MTTTRTVPAGHPERPEGEDGKRLLARMNGGRHEDLALWGLSQVEIADDARVLDIGCGGGANIARLLERASNGHVSGLDFSPLSVATSREHNSTAIEAGRCAVVEGDSSALPFGDGAFNLVTAFETVYYWDIAASFAEVLRVLAPGGRFLICNEDDGRSPESVEFAKLVPTMTMHTPEVLEAALLAAGFASCKLAEREGGDFTLVACK